MFDRPSRHTTSFQRLYDVACLLGDYKYASGTEIVVIQLFLNLQIFKENFILQFAILTSTMESRNKQNKKYI